MFHNSKKAKAVLAFLLSASVVLSSFSFGTFANDEYVDADELDYVEFDDSDFVDEDSSSVTTTSADSTLRKVTLTSSVPKGLISGVPTKKVATGSAIPLTVNKNIGYIVKTLNVTNVKTGGIVDVSNGGFKVPNADVSISVTFGLADGYHYLDLATKYITTLSIVDSTTKVYCNNLYADQIKREGTKAVVKKGTKVTLSPNEHTMTGTELKLTAAVTASGKSIAIDQDKDTGAFSFKMPDENVSYIKGEVVRKKNAIFSGSSWNTASIGAGVKLGTADLTTTVPQVITSGKLIKFDIKRASGVIVTDLTGLTKGGTPVKIGSIKNADGTYSYQFIAPDEGIALKRTVTLDDDYYAVKTTTSNFTLNGSKQKKIFKEDATVTVVTDEASKVSVRETDGSAVEVRTVDSQTFKFTMPGDNVTLTVTASTGVSA